MQSTATNKARIGLIGLGYLGRYVYEQITSRPQLGREVAFVHDLAAERLHGLPEEVVLKDLKTFAARSNAQIPSRVSAARSHSTRRSRRSAARKEPLV